VSRSRSKAAPARQPKSPSRSTRTWIAPLVVALCTFIAFAPTLGNAWVTWDDDRNFLENLHYRGLDGSHLHWMWTTTLMGHYIPVSWMTLGLDYEIWGMDARGYHLTNLLLHCVNAVLIYFIARRMLRLAAPSLVADDDPPRLDWAAGVAALFFAIHPLRVESVAWVTERRDVLSGCFFWAATLTYLRYADDAERGRRWYWITLALYVFAMLSKATSITLPAILLLLNVYPLKRLGGAAGWWTPIARKVYLEILPVGIISLGAIPVTILALAPPNQLTLGAKIAVSAYSLALYLWKTILPIGLSPLYAMPLHVNALEPRFIVSYVAVIVLAFAAWFAWRRRPSVTMALLGFLAVTFPLLGIVQNGPQIAADRYTYHAAPALAVLAGGVVLFALGSGFSSLVRPISALGLVALGALTWRQSEVWHDPATFWNYVLARDPQSSIAETALGTLLVHSQRYQDAIPHLEHATSLDPTYAEGHDNYGIALSNLGRVDEAIAQFHTAIALAPRNHESHNNLGIALARQDKLQEAIVEYRTALSINPDYADAQTNWGNASLRLGNVDDAIAHYREAVRLRPDVAGPQLNWGVALAQRGRYAEAVEHFRAALTLDPNDADAQNYLQRATQLLSSPATSPP
jgi:tetratricopeptide (TPR) repeat protein